MNSKIKLIILVVICFTQWSCNNDDSSTVDGLKTETLIGEWLREDATNNSQNKLVFTNNTSINDSKKGLIISNQIANSGETISSLSEFDWKINDGILVVTNGDLASSPLNFITANQILLPNISQFLFNKIGNAENF